MGRAWMGRRERVREVVKEVHGWVGAWMDKLVGR
jgi:hypothetical protein